MWKKIIKTLLIKHLPILFGRRKTTALESFVIAMHTICEANGITSQKDLLSVTKEAMELIKKLVETKKKDLNELD